MQSQSSSSTATTKTAGLLRLPRRAWLSLVLLLIALVAIINEAVTTTQAQFFLTERFQTFVLIFLGIFIEAVPFLLAGALVSGFIHIFVNQTLLTRLLPRNPIWATLTGAGLGLLFPVCECGVVPVTRRLYAKGLPMSVGIAFLLAAPVVNPVVLISTYSAFGWGPILWGRFFFSILIAFVVGLLFYRAPAQAIVLSSIHTGHDHTHHHGHTWLGRIQASLDTATDDFLDMSRYLIVGSMLAALMQTFVPQTALLAVGQGPFISVFAMQLLAFVLSVCSTVDSFLALAFSGSFTTGSILAFLTFGPMVDIKSSLMFLGVFRRTVVLRLILLPLVLSFLIGVIWNLSTGA